MAAPMVISCPICERDVPLDAKFCPHCGAVIEVDEPSDQKPKEEKFDDSHKREGLSLGWRITAIVLVVVMAALTFYDLLFR